MRILALSLLLLLGSPALAQVEAGGELTQEMIDAFERGCGDDQGVDRCDSATQQRMRTLYGLDSARDLMEQGVQLRRAMFVDGYGNDVVAISFSRVPGRGPMVEVISPIVEGAPEAQPLRAMIDQATWGEVLARSENFDQLLARELPRRGEDGQPEAPRSLCLHAWFSVVEAVDPARNDRNSMQGSMSMEDVDGAETVEMLPVRVPGLIRVDAESACASGLGTEYAFALADIAADLFGECTTLDADRFRNPPELLAACHRLGGDRLAAGEAMPIVHAFNRSASEDDFSRLFSGMGDGRMQRFRAELDGGFPQLWMPHAASPDEAHIAGRIFYLSEDRNELVASAELQLQLMREFDRWVISSWTIGEREPAAAAN